MPGTENRTFRDVCMIAAALVALPLAQAAAQTVPVQNIDEPARNPYQETLYGGKPAFPQEVLMTFKSVPANTRRVIKHVNCDVAIAPGHTINAVAVVTANSMQTDYLPMLSRQTVFNNKISSIYGENPELYLDPFDAPSVLVVTDDPAPFTQCRLSGYDVNLAAPVTPPPS